MSLLPGTHGHHRAYVCRRAVGSAPRTGMNTSYSEVTIPLPDRYVSCKIGASNPIDRSAAGDVEFGSKVVCGPVT